MPNLNYSYTNPFLALPVGISQEDFQSLIDASDLSGIIFTRDTDSDVIYVEVGNERADTPDFIAGYLDKHFTGLLDKVISQDCEAIQFFID